MTTTTTTRTLAGQLHDGTITADEFLALRTPAAESFQPPRRPRLAQKAGLYRAPIGSKADAMRARCACGSRTCPASWGDLCDR